MASQTRTDEARDLIAQLWGCACGTRFMGATPVALDATTLPRVARRGQYLVTPKTDGERIALLFGLGEGDEEYVVTVDRSGRVEEIDVGGIDARAAFTVAPMGITDAAPDLYAGTLMDGERMGDDTIVLLDCIGFCGYQTKDLPFTKRYAAATQLAEALPGHLRTKPFYPAHLAARALGDETHPHDGLIFVPQTEPAYPGRQPSLLKWKPVQTVDLRYEGRHRWTLAADDGTGCVPATDVGITVTKGKGVNVKLRIGKIFEVAPSSEGWCVVRARPDKEVPNTAMTARHTVEVQQSSISEADLLAAL